MNAKKTAQIATVTAALAILAALVATPAILSAVSASPTSNSALVANSTDTASTSTAATTTSTTSSNSNASGPATTVVVPGQQWMRPPSRGGPGAYFQAGPGGRYLSPQSSVNLAVGQTITITSTQGKYFVIGTPSNNGTASGTLTFTATAKLSHGYTLSLTSGSLTVNGATYTVSSGSAQMGTFADQMTGQGATTPTGTFLFQARAMGSFAGTTGSISLDFSNGTTEYAIVLTGTVQG